MGIHLSRRFSVCGGGKGDDSVPFSAFSFLFTPFPYLSVFPFSSSEQFSCFQQPFTCPGNFQKGVQIR